MAATLSSAFRFLLLLPLLLGITHAATFEIVNRCSYTVWPAAAPGGGTQLNPGQSWTIPVNPGTAGGRIWARTSCSFDGSGRGSCQTGDCGGLLRCQGTGRPPATLAEFSLNQFNNLDFFDISNIEGFNVPLDFSPTTGGCRGVRCAADIVGQCPAELRAPGGCNNPCTVSGDCEPSAGSMFFKRLCPDAYSYPNDSGTVSCPGGTNYRITFCPGGTVMTA